MQRRGHIQFPYQVSKPAFPIFSRHKEAFKLETGFVLLSESDREFRSKAFRSKINVQPRPKRNIELKLTDCLILRANDRPESRKRSITWPPPTHNPTECNLGCAVDLESDKDGENSIMPG